MLIQSKPINENDEIPKLKTVMFRLITDPVYKFYIKNHKNLPSNSDYYIAIYIKNIPTCLAFTNKFNEIEHNNERFYELDICFNGNMARHIPIDYLPLHMTTNQQLLFLGFNYPSQNNKFDIYTDTVYYKAHNDPYIPDAEIPINENCTRFDIFSYYAESMLNTYMISKCDNNLVNSYFVLIQGIILASPPNLKNILMHMYEYITSAIELKIEGYVLNDDCNDTGYLSIISEDEMRRFVHNKSIKHNPA